MTVNEEMNETIGTCSRPDLKSSTSGSWLHTDVVCGMLHALYNNVNKNCSSPSNSLRGIWQKK
jgi:hypothetical protein